MFHLKPRDELAFGNPTSDSMYLNDELLFMDNGFAITENINPAGTSSNSTVKKQKGAEFRTGEREEELRKRAMHRDIERKRRQEMSQLYDTLRSLIPHEQLKGKRSLSDLMNEAVSYTKQLEKKVQESRIQRDKLRGYLSSHTKIGGNNIEPNNNNCVSVNYWEQDGIEILINTTSSKFGLSLVMIELVARELDVVSCVSTKSDDILLHKILARANDTRLVDLSVMQERLTAVVSLSLG